jgi:hypothetical protein
MNYVIRYPRKRGKRQLFHVIVVVFFVFFAGCIESISRKASDLESPEIYCGVLKDYYFDKNKIRGFATWRAVIKKDNAGLNRRIFLVGDSYILNSNALSANDIGSEACVEFLENILPAKHPFISQISINGNKRLSSDVVKDNYLRPLSVFDKTMVVLSFLIGFCLLIQPGRG